MTAAHALRPGDALMPLYRDRVRGYETVYQPLDGHLCATHRLADEWNLRHKIYAGTPGTHRHHVDFNRRNYQPIDRSVVRRFPDVNSKFRGTPAYRNHKVAAVRELAGEFPFASGRPTDRWAILR